MKKIICFLLTVIMLWGMIPAAAVAGGDECPFEDVSVKHWWYAPIAYCYENDLLRGMSDTEFGPTVTLTRAMFVQALANFEGITKKDVKNEKSPFTDIKPSHWYYVAVEWARQNKIVAGMTDTTFVPNAPLTRAQMATLFYRYAQYKGMDVSGKADLTRFSDNKAIPKWARAGVVYCVAAGLMQGNNNAFTPGDTATRAQLATVVMNFHELSLTPCVHELGDWVVVTEPQIGVEGLKKNVCIKCGETLTAVIDALTEPTPEEPEDNTPEEPEDTTPDECAHRWGEWVVLEDASYSTEGVKERTCTLCNEVDTAIIPVLVCDSHMWDAWEVTVEATYTTEGVKERYCAVCDEKQTEVIPMLVCEHNWSEWTNDTEANENDEKTKRRSCSICNTVEVKVIPRIICWGDSLTQGILRGFGDLATVPYPEKMAEIFGDRVSEVINYGIGGEQSFQIAARQGGIDLFAYATVDEPFVIPADCTPVEISIYNEAYEEEYGVNFIGNGAEGLLQAINPVKIGDVLGNIEWVAGSNYTFTRLKAGEEVAYTEHTPLYTHGSLDKRESDIVIIWAGHNDMPINVADEAAQDVLVDNIKAMVEAAGTEKFLVLGLMGERYVPDYQETNDKIVAYLESIGAADKYLDVRSYLADIKHLEDLGITPTEKDLEWLEKGWIPSSLHGEIYFDPPSDELHLSEDGYHILAKYVAEKIEALGYLD